MRFSFPYLWCSNPKYRWSFRDDRSGLGLEKEIKVFLNKELEVELSSEMGPGDTHMFIPLEADSYAQICQPGTSFLGTHSPT